MPRSGQVLLAPAGLSLGSSRMYFVTSPRPGMMMRLMMTFLLNFSWSLLVISSAEKAGTLGTRFLSAAPFCSSFPSPSLHKVKPI